MPIVLFGVDKRKIKRFLTHWFLLAATLCLAHSVYANPPISELRQINSVNVPVYKESGLTLDIARHFYPVEVIKAFIDVIHRSGGTFLHLHFSDHENYALESTILHQRTENARKDQKGVYINPQTNKPFLSYVQLAEIVKYAKERNIELIPELGSPNHMNGIFTLLEKQYGQEYAASLKSKWNADEIDITNPKSMAFIQSLMVEVIDIFGDSSQHFHIGGDEFGYSVDSNHEFVTYANTLNDFLRQKGLIARMWNDGVIRATVDQLNPHIEITYWSYDGDTQDQQEADKRRQIRVGLPELVEKGFKVLNYNSYYLYLNPKSGSLTSHDSNYAMRDALENWSLGVWDGQNKQNMLKHTGNVLGASLSIWGKDAGTLSAETIQKYTSELLETVIRKTNVAPQRHSESNKSLFALAENHFEKLLQTTYIDLAQADDNTTILLDNYNQAVYLLNTGQKQSLTIWIQGLKRHQLRMPPVCKKQSETTMQRNKSFQLYECENQRLWVDSEITVVTE